MLTALCDATIFTGEAMVEDHALLIRGSKIVDIVGNRKIPADAKKTSCPDAILAPGFIDAQVNGGGNVLFNNTPTTEACLAIAEAHRKYGTTSLLLTCITDTPQIIRKALAAEREARKTNASILGIHIEGPHLSDEAHGVHKKDYVRAATAADLSLYKPKHGEVMLVTVAPENISVEQIALLKHHDTIVSLGHTDASANEVRAAFDAGATGFTHIFNGTKPGSKAGGQIPEPVKAALEDKQSWCSIIADGDHLSPDIIRLVLRTKPPGKIFLISDAMAPAASDSPQSFKIYDETIHVEDDRCVRENGKFAGSMITMLDAVRYCVTYVGLDIEEALRMGSAYPAAFLGVGDRLGKLLPGFKADVVVLDHMLGLKAVI